MATPMAPNFLRWLAEDAFLKLSKIRSSSEGAEDARF
jgi:hypothetical protein